MCLGLLACCACNACSCCVQGTCKMFGKAFSVSLARIAYVAVFVAMSFAAWALGTWLPGPALDRLAVFRECESSLNYRACYVNMMVTRLMFALASWHLLHAVVLIGVSHKDDPRGSIQNGWWLIKILLLAGVAVGTMWVPNVLAIVWGWITLFGAALFVVIQIIMLIDFASEWAHGWIEKMEEEQMDGGGGYDESGKCCVGNKWFALLLGCTFAMFAVALAITVLLYVFFSHAVTPGGCGGKGKNVAFVTINLVLCIVVTAMSVVPKIREKKPDSGLLQAALLSMYTSYLVFSALVSEPASWMAGCNNVFTPASATNSTVGQKVVIIIGALMTIVAVCYSTFRTSGRSDKLGLAPSSLFMSNGDTQGDKGSSSADDDLVTYSYTAFHIIFALGAMYVEQLLTNWQTIQKPSMASGSNVKEIRVDNGVASVWVKIVSSWIVFLLYIWTLIAPIIFPNRDFGSGV